MITLKPIPILDILSPHFITPIPHILFDENCTTYKDYKVLKWQTNYPFYCISGYVEWGLVMAMRVMYWGGNFEREGWGN